MAFIRAFYLRKIFFLIVQLVSDSSSLGSREATTLLAAKNFEEYNLGLNIFLVWLEVFLA